MDGRPDERSASQETVERVFDEAIALPESARVAFVDASGLDEFWCWCQSCKHGGCVRACVHACVCARACARFCPLPSA